MEVPQLLQNPSVKAWLGGIEPAWTLLDPASAAALYRPPAPNSGPIRLAADLGDEELCRSAVARNAQILLRAAATGAGLKLTETGNLSRAVVAQMLNSFTWPDFDKEELLWVSKVTNEPDFLPLFFLRHLAEAGKLLRRYKGHLRLAPAGRLILEEANRRKLQALLFYLAMWHLDLGYFGRFLHRGWPQRDIGIILWCLSVAASDWQAAERLTRLCTIPIADVLDTPWDTSTNLTEACILRPLQWFGLLDHRQEDSGKSPFARRHFYRKTALFDRFLAFDIKLPAAAGARH